LRHEHRLAGAAAKAAVQRRGLARLVRQRRRERVAEAAARRRAAFAALTGAVALAFGIAAAPALAESTSIDFESYDPGAVVGQQGWTGNDYGPVIDEGVVQNSGLGAAARRQPARRRASAAVGANTIVVSPPLALRSAPRRAT
jgi:hypothetical protein